MEKYSNVIMQRADKDEFLSNLYILSEAFKVDSFKEIIKAVNVQNNKKIEFLLSFCKFQSLSFRNFIKILALNHCLDKIPLIYKNLVKKIALKDNVFQAVIYTISPLSESEILKYEEKLSSHFSKKIKLTNEISSKKEIRVSLEDLGYEVIISNEILRQKLKQFIIKAV